MNTSPVYTFPWHSQYILECLSQGMDKFLIILHDSMVNFASLSDSPSRLTQEGRHSFVLQLHFANAFLIVLITLPIDLESFPCTPSLLVCEFLEDKNHTLNNYTVLGTKRVFNVYLLNRKISYKSTLLYFFTNIYCRIYHI